MKNIDSDKAFLIVVVSLTVIAVSVLGIYNAQQSAKCEAAGGLMVRTHVGFTCIRADSLKEIK